MKILKDMKARAEYLPALAAFKLMGLLPYRSFGAIGRVFGSILYFLPGFGSLCRVNIHAAFPEKDAREVKAIAHRSLENLVRTLCEFFWACSHPDEFAETVDLTNCRVCAEEGLRRMEDGTGAILVTPHLGNWEFAGRILSQLFHYRMATVVKTARNPYLDRLITGGRSVKNVQIIHSRGGMLKLVHAMENGCSAGMLIDQNTKIRNGGVFVDFFGIPCPVSRFPATMALKKNAYIGVGSCIRKPDGRFHATMRKLPKPLSEYTSEKEITQDIMTISEDLIRMAPEQYLWLYKRFQYIPPDAPESIRAKFPDYACVPSERFFDNAARARAKREEEKE